MANETTQGVVHLGEADSVTVPTPADSGPTKPKRRGKPDFPTFLRELESVARGGFAQLKRMLATGYKGSVSPAQVEDVFACIRNSHQCSRVALELWCAKPPKKRPELIRLLRFRLLSHARLISCFPASAADGAERAAEVHDWVRATRERLNSPSGDTTSRLDGIRWGLVSLAEERFEVAQDAIYRLLDAVSDPQLERDSGALEESFLAELPVLLGGDKPSVSRIETALRLAGGARCNQQRVNAEVQKTRSEAADSASRTAAMVQEIASLREALSAEGDRRRASEEALAEKTHELERQIRERERDHEHWEAIGQQRRARDRSEIVSRLTHDINEARICLTEPPVNIKMAIERLMRIEKWLNTKGN